MHRSGDIDVQEFGWFLADSAGTKENMAATIENFKGAVDYVHERMQKNAHPLFMDKAHRDQYGRVLVGHRKVVDQVFQGLDLAKDGVDLLVRELELIMREWKKGAFDKAAFDKFWDIKDGPDDVLSREEFGWYLAELAGCEHKMHGIIEEFKEHAKVVHEKHVSGEL